MVKMSKYERFRDLHRKFVKANNGKPEQARLSRSTLMGLAEEMKEFEHALVSPDSLTEKKISDGWFFMGVRLIIDPNLPDDEIVFEGKRTSEYRGEKSRVGILKSPSSSNAREI